MGPAEDEAGMRADFLSIQYLRGLAALGVLLFHACGRMGVTFSPGAAGADVFFIISGFIIWTISGRRGTGAGAFLLRRAGRIAPLYWLVILLVAAVHGLEPTLLHAQRLTPAHVIQSMLFLPHRDAAGGAAPVLAQGWTLYDEAFFYALFALTLLLPRGRRSVTLAAALGALSFLGLILPHGRWPAFDAYTDPLLLEFAAGVWLAKAAAGGLLGRTWQALVAIGAGLAVLTAVGVTGVEVEGWTRLPCFGLPALAIVWGALSLEGCGRVPLIAPLKSLGDASYSLYLTQGLALSLALALLDGADVPVRVQMALAIAAALACGLACHHLVERPLLAMFHGRRARKAALRVRMAGWAFLRPKVQP